MILKIGEAAEAGEPGKINLVELWIEVIDRVVLDWLGEHEQILATRAGQMVLARPGENRRTRLEDLDVIVDRCRTCDAITTGPAGHDAEHGCTNEVPRRGDRQRAQICCLRRPDAAWKLGRPIEGPTRRKTGNICREACPLSCQRRR